MIWSAFEPLPKEKFGGLRDGYYIQGGGLVRKGERL